MSSARKRAAIQKANSEADRLRQRLMLAENHINILRTFAEAIGRGGDVMREALKRIADGPWPDDCEGPEEQCRFDAAVAREALAIVGAGDTALKGSNGEVRGASRLAGEASSREAATSTVVLGDERPGKD